VARITLLAQGATHAPLGAVVAIGLTAAAILCIYPSVLWLGEHLDDIAALLRRHAHRIAHALGAENRRIEEWADEIAPRPEGPA
jgi:hypothetical protein